MISTHPLLRKDGLLAAQGARDGEALRGEVGGQAPQAERVKAGQDLEKRSMKSVRKSDDGWL